MVLKIAATLLTSLQIVQSPGNGAERNPGRVALAMPVKPEWATYHTRQS